ncbi:hypothetical protein [Occallatibacter riparius]|uniref:Lysozyme inhibitor LprI N-terminal domain-containing protein n=1 Tax=Occallatibacter riparius TaxID=1002689 RepID=A0A9J7BUF0_9BACT|nr:hypothetical protein [Occallatibacter riparius]UWZ86500.1 hypothetical protein MOP44_11270 [Occallatibacter riparius]
MKGFWILPAAMVVLSATAWSQHANSAIDYSEQTKLRAQGTEALERERARAKVELCEKAFPGGNAAIGECLTAEGKITESNYLAYARAIRGMLLLGEAPSAKKLPFDVGEELWHQYREQSCKSMSTQWERSQAAVAYSDCRMKLTWNHMIELADLYRDLWH